MVPDPSPNTCLWHETTPHYKITILTVEDPLKDRLEIIGSRRVGGNGPLPSHSVLDLVKRINLMGSRLINIE